MATNAYYAEQRISFNPEKPSSYYGYYISYSGYSVEVHAFETEKIREDYEKAIAAAMPGEDEFDQFLAAAIACVVGWGNEVDQDSESLTLTDKFEDHHEAILEAAFSFRDRDHEAAAATPDVQKRAP